MSNPQTGSMPDTTSIAYARRSSLMSAFDRLASSVTRAAGTPLAFGLAAGLVIGWAACGPLFHYSENWQLVINTSTTIITFLMVFVIQQSQNKDSVAMHMKLNELLAANRQASNRMVGIEQLDAQQLEQMAAYYVKLAETARAQGAVKQTFSIDDELARGDAAAAPAKPS